MTVWALPTLHKGTVAFSALRALAKDMQGTLARGHVAHMFPDLLYPLPALASQTVPGVRVSIVPSFGAHAPGGRGPAASLLHGLRVGTCRRPVGFSSLHP